MGFYPLGETRPRGRMGSAGWTDSFTESAWQRDTSSWCCSIQQRHGHRTLSPLLKGTGRTALPVSVSPTNGSRPSPDHMPTCATKLRSAFAARRNQETTTYPLSGRYVDFASSSSRAVLRYWTVAKEPGLRAERQLGVPAVRFRPDQALVDRGPPKA